MAASDPTMDVPTPTGTLQGVAAFSWDGSAWQPSGRAGPSVATPTGVLRGVAAFNGGPAWQPSGRAQPGVATPTGALDGVAVYTWSGSAWTPLGGTATPSTPTGALRGVAAFNWDGAAWQPAAQAGPSVATPYGVLDGVAMFNWTGSAWAAVGAPSLSLDFMQPGSLDPRLTFTRASIGTYFDATGTMRTAATNTARWDYDPSTHALRGLLIEDQGTNVIPSSGDFSGWGAGNTTVTPGQAGAPDGTAAFTRYTETSANGAHYLLGGWAGATAPSTMLTFSVYARAQQNRYLQLALDDGGSGACTTFDLQTGTISGAQAAYGTVYPLGGAAIQAVGGGTYRCSTSNTIGANTGPRTAIVLTNAPAAGFTPGYIGNPANGLLIWGAQLEQGAFPTSYIPTTSVAVTRAQDQCRIPSANMGFFASPGGSWAAEFIMFNPVSASANPRLVGNSIAAGGLAPLLANGINALQQYDGSALQAGPNAIVPNAISKGASTWAPSTGRVCLNAGAIASGPLTTGYAALVTSGIGFMTLGSPGVSDVNVSGCMRRLRYWPRVLTNAELQAVTT